MGKMKKIFIFYIFIIFTFHNICLTRAQVSSLYQNFDVPCVTIPYFPANWLLYNPIPATATYGAWTCSQTDGNNHTPGVECSGFYSGAYHVDTSYLITPMLNFANDVGHHLYLRFDSRTSNIYLGSGLTVIRSPNPDSAVAGSGHNFGLTSTIYPSIGLDDSLGWVTHEVEITSSENYGNFYLTFMYTSDASSGSTWYIDNVVTDTQSMKLNVPQVSGLELPLKVVGVSTKDEISISYSVLTPGPYHLSIYDMMGREVYSDVLSCHAGSVIYTIKGLSLYSGMYCVKLGDGTTYSVAKTIVR
jgi:hypothetical protein